MRTLRARCEAFVAAVCTRFYRTLRARKQIDDQSEETGEEDQQHPKDRSIHAAALRIACYPNQQSDVQNYKPKEENKGETTTREATCCPRCSFGVGRRRILRLSKNN